MQRFLYMLVQKLVFQLSQLQPLYVNACRDAEDKSPRESETKAFQETMGREINHCEVLAELV